MKCFIALLALFALCGAAFAEMKMADNMYLVDEANPGDHTGRCTATAAGKLATDDLFTALTYTADCKECDNRIVKVPAASNKAGAKKKIIDSLKADFPRYIGNDRGSWYEPKSKEDKETPERGFIPESEQTFAYFDAVYGIMNEHGLGMGESSCYSRFPVGPNSTALFEIAELSRVALERCKNARCAIKLMGELSEKYGFYGPDGEYGEALTIIDNEEAWVFHISGTPDEKSAVWVAQRVPDDHIAAIGNWYVIHEVEADSDDFMYSSNMFDIAKKYLGWNPEVEAFNFAKFYAPKNKLPTYTTRRVWRVYDLAAPSLKLDGHVTEDLKFPFSVKVDKKLPISFFMKVNRDYYEGTEFDLTKGLAAGPFGTPFRQEFKMHPDQVKFERAISIHRTSYSLVVQNRGQLDPSVGAVAWVAPDTPHASCYVPLYAGAKDVEESYAVGSLKTYSRNAWWAFDFVANFINLKFSYMIEDVRAMQERKEGYFFEQDKTLVKKFNQLKGKGKVGEALDMVSKYVIEESAKLVEDWWKFGEGLIVKYNDGYINTPTNIGKPVAYPDHWMNIYTEDHKSGGLLEEVERLKKELKDLKAGKEASVEPTVDDKTESSSTADKALPAAAHNTPSATSHFGAIFVGIVVGVASASAMFVVVKKKKDNGYSRLV